MATKTQEELDAEAAAAKAAEEAAAKAEADKAAAAEQHRQTEEARIRAEAERDALKAVMATQTGAQTQATWGDTEWKRFEDETGMDRKQLAANAQVAKTIVEQQMVAVREEIKQAEARAKAAEERAASLEHRTNEVKLRQEFYQSKPALARYDKDVDEFVSRFPADQRNDPKQYKELLGMAEVYVRGKVGATMKQTPGSSSSFDRGSDVGGGEGGSTEEIDMEGLDNRHRDMLMSIKPTKEQEQRLKELDAKKYDKNGVYYDSSREWGEVRDGLAKRGSL